jgi:hypothetical protein
MNTTINEIYALISMLLIVIILLFGLGVRLAIKTANTTYTNLNNKINTLENLNTIKMNTTINEIYALISMLLIVIILLFGLGVRLAIKTANATYTNLNNKINTLENITLEKLMLVEEQNKKINDMDETILSLIEQNKLLVKSHYNIVYDINNIQTTISHLTDDTSCQIEELKNIVVSTNEKNEKTHATYILEEQTKIDELKNQLIELSTNISLTNDKITNVENANVSNNNDTEEEEVIEVTVFLYDGEEYFKTADNLLYKDREYVGKITKNNEVVFQSESDEESEDGIYDPE